MSKNHLYKVLLALLAIVLLAACAREHGESGPEKMDLPSPAVDPTGGPLYYNAASDLGRDGEIVVQRVRVVPDGPGEADGRRKALAEYANRYEKSARDGFDECGLPKGGAANEERFLVDLQVAEIAADAPGVRLLDNTIVVRKAGGEVVATYHARQELFGADLFSDQALLFFEQDIKVFCELIRLQAQGPAPTGNVEKNNPARP